MSTSLLATLKGVFVDGTTVTVSPTLQPLRLPQYVGGHIDIFCVGSNNAPRDITAITLLLGVRLHPTDLLPAISLQATVIDGPGGHARFELIPGHWLSVPPAAYEYDVVAVIANSDDRVPIVPKSLWQTTDENVHPGDAIQVPASQQPLAQGPAGPPGVAGSAGDIQPVGLAAAAGSSFKYADASHVHLDRAVANVAGSYTNANITVDAYGRVVAAASGSGSTNPFTAPIADGLYTHMLSVGSVASGVFLKITAGDPSAWNDFYITYHSNNDNPDTANDNVFCMGHNLGFGGGVVVSGRGGNGIQLENHYEPHPETPTVWQNESHWVTFDENDQQTRVLSILQPRVGLPTLFVDAGQILIGIGNNGNAPPAIALEATTLTLASPVGVAGGANGAKTILFDDGSTSLILSSVNGGNTTTINMLAGVPSVSPAILGLDSSSLVRISVGGMLGFEMIANGGSSTTQIFDPFDNTTHLDVGSGLMQFWCSNTLPFMVTAGQNYSNVLLQLPINASVGTNTRGDQIGRLLLRTNHDATALSTQEFSPALVITGYGWTGSANRAVSVEMQVHPDGAGAGSLAWLYSSDEANYTFTMGELSSVGALKLSAGLGLFGVTPPAQQTLPATPTTAELRAVFVALGAVAP